MMPVEQVSDIFADEAGLTIIQLDEAKRDPMVVARLLSQVTALPAVDLTATVRKRRGPIILENLRPEIAELLVGLLEQNGVQAHAVPTGELMVPRLAGNATRLDYTMRELKATVGHTDHEIPWDTLALVSVAWVQIHSIQRDFLPGETTYDFGGGEHTGDVRVKDKSVAEKHLLADVFYALPEGCFYVRLEARHLAFAHLGDRLKPSTLENFRLVLQDICDRASDLQQSERCKAFLAGAALPQNAALASVETFDEENLRALALPW